MNEMEDNTITRRAQEPLGMVGQEIRAVLYFLLRLKVTT